MPAAAIIRKLCASGVSLAVVAPNRLRVEAPSGVVTTDLLAIIAQHKAEILSELTAQGAGHGTSRLCPFCKQVGIRTHQTKRDGLQYFDTICLHCGEILETYVSGCCEPVENTVGLA